MTGANAKIKKIYVGENLVYPVWKPNANTIAYYPLTSNANDYSGNGYNATNDGITFSNSNGGYFGVYPSKLYPPSMTIGNTFTISFYVKLDANPTGSQEFDLYYDWSYSYRNFLYRLGTNKIDCWTGNNTTSEDTTITTSISDFTNWHNYIVVKNGTSIKIYKDGNTTPILSKTSSYNPSIPGGRNTVYIGIPSSATYGAKGYLKDYIIENKARSASEVSDYYNVTKSKYGL